MANKKISELTALGAAPATDDVLPIVDVSGTATTKKVTVANLLSPHAPLADPNFTGHVEVSQSDVSQFTTYTSHALPPSPQLRVPNCVHFNSFNLTH